MTGADHDRLRDLTAAYVLGALGPADRAEVEDHLNTCDACRQDVVDFAPLPALLSRVDPDDLDATSSPAAADPVVEAVRLDLHRLRRRERRWRAVAAVATLAVVAGTAWAVADGGSEPSRSGGVALAVAAGADAQVVADERPWGTYLHLAAADLPDRTRYAIWTVDAGGRWEPVGSWAATADGRVELGCSTSRSLGEIDRVVVTSDDRSDVLLEARA